MTANSNASTLGPFDLDTIQVGDCVEGLSQLPEGSVDLAFADPPFNIGYKYDQYDDARDADEYVQWCGEWMSKIYRALKPTGAFWLAIGDEYAAELKVEAKRVGFHTRNWVVWYYTFGVHCKHKFTRSHAHLFYFVKDPKKFTFNREAIAVPSARQLVYGDRRANPTGRVPDDTWILRPQDCPESFQSDEDTWYFPRVNGTFKERAGFHGCQMPEQLLGRIIRACSDPGEIVIDPFSGSSTTAAVAKKLQRRFLNFELSEQYVELGTQRLQKITPGDPLDGAEQPLCSAPATNSAGAVRLSADGKRVRESPNAPLSRKKKATKKTTAKKEKAAQEPSLKEKAPKKKKATKKATKKKAAAKTADHATPKPKHSKAKKASSRSENSASREKQAQPETPMLF